MSRYLEIQQQVPRRQNVRKQAAKSTPKWSWQEWLAASAVISSLLLAALLSVWSSGRIVTLGYQISGQISTRQKLLDEKRELELEVYRLENPKELEIKAAKLGFVKPAVDQFIRIETNGAPAPSK